MPHIRMLDIEEIGDPEIREMIREAERHRAPDPNFFRMMAHNPELAKRFYRTWQESFNGGAIDHRLKEVIRVKMSRMVGCSY
ncbi:MAG: hypothetical protein ACE5JJ_04530 [Nitrospinota bacterium]